MSSAASNLERYHEAKERREQAGRALHDFAARFRQLATQFAEHEQGLDYHGEGLRVSTGPVRTFKHTIHKDNWPKWDDAVVAMRNYYQADDAFRNVVMDLTPEDRNRLGL
jgi:hypothetical protein